MRVEAFYHHSVLGPTSTVRMSIQISVLLTFRFSIQLSLDMKINSGTMAANDDYSQHRLFMN